MLQHMQWSVEQTQHANQLLHEERAALAATLALIPDLDMDGLTSKLEHLGGEYLKVAEADLDAMFMQVRSCCASRGTWLTMGFHGVMGVMYVRNKGHGG